jgi:hypothetical protein
MKMKECEQRGISVGFIDPYIVNEKMLHDYPVEVESDLFTFLTKHSLKREILFPYNYR